MVVAEIDRDYQELGCIGNIFTLDMVNRAAWDESEELQVADLEKEKTRFRVLDDDREVYAGGWLYNDPQCIVQQAVVAWSSRDSGAIHIQIRKDGEWVYEIG